MFSDDDDFEALPEAACRELLAAHHVGRLGVTIRALPFVVPVRYGYLGGSVIIANRHSQLRRAVGEGAVVALGVDNRTETGAYWSVLVVGEVTRVSDAVLVGQLDALGLVDQHDGDYFQLGATLIGGFQSR